MKKVIIREPRESEYEEWVEVYKVYLNFYQTDLTDAELKKVWSWMFEENKQLYCFLAEIDQKIVGLAHFRKFIRPIKASVGIYLDDLIVLPEFRGFKIGYQLVKAVKNYAKENTFSLVRWITAHDNTQAMQLYNSIANKTSWITYDAKLG